MPVTQVIAVDFFDRHGAYYDVLFDYESLDHDASVQTVLQHREILEALLRRDRRAAERALVSHIRTNHPLVNRSKSSRTSNH